MHLQALPLPLPPLLLLSPHYKHGSKQRVEDTPFVVGGGFAVRDGFVVGVVFAVRDGFVMGGEFAVRDVFVVGGGFAVGGGFVVRGEFVVAVTTVAATAADGEAFPDIDSSSSRLRFVAGSAMMAAQWQLSSSDNSSLLLLFGWMVGGKLSINCAAMQARDSMQPWRRGTSRLRHLRQRRWPHRWCGHVAPPPVPATNTRRTAATPPLTSWEPQRGWGREACSFRW